MNTKSTSVRDSFDPAIVEAIVREVMVRLGEKSSASPGPAMPSPVASAESQQVKTETQVANETQNTKQLVVNDRVVTLESLRGQLEGRQTLVVPANAVVTPAVRDELSSRQIGLEIRAAGAVHQSNGNSAQACLARLTDHYVPTQWLKDLGVSDVCSGATYADLAKQLVKKVIAGKAICLAGQPFVAAAMLNRLPEVKAAFGRTEKEVREIKSTLQANVLVLDSVEPREKLIPLIQVFLSGGKVNS